MFFIKNLHFSLPAQLRTTFNWNAIESILYQSMLTAHLWALAATLPKETFGLLGTFFAAIYGITTICALGFEGTLAHFFKQLQNRLAMQRFFCLHLGISYIALFLVSGSLLSGYRFFVERLPQLTVNNLLLMIAIIAIELIRRTSRSMLQLALKQRPMAYLEVTVLLTYIVVAWWYILTVKIPTISTLLMLLCLTLSLSCLPYLVTVYRWINTLPADFLNPLTFGLATSSLGKRILISMHQFLLTATSSNMLIPLYACSAGPAHAAQLKLISQTVHSLILIIHHAVGLTGLAHFARTTSNQAHSTITSSLNTILYPLIFFLCGCALGTSILYPLESALCFLLIMQPLTMLYYHYAIIRGAFYILLSIDLTMISSLMAIGYQYQHISFITVVVLLGFIQLLLTAALSIISKRLWLLPTPSVSCVLYLIYGLLTGMSACFLFTNIK